MAASSIQELIKSKIAVNNPSFEGNKISLQKKISKSEQGTASARGGNPGLFSEKFKRPTLLKNPETSVDKAKINVAEAHSTLTRASVHADIEKKAKAHRRVQLGFTRTPRVISKLIN